MNERTSILDKLPLVLGLWALYHLVVWTLRNRLHPPTKGNNERQAE